MIRRILQVSTWALAVARARCVVLEVNPNVPYTYGNCHVHVSKVTAVVEDDAPADDPDLLGYYDGFALTERPANHAGALPDRILLFRRPLMEMCEDRDQLVDEIRITVVHEIAHHFGIDDARLHELGYA